MAHFWLTYREAGRPVGVVIVDAPSLIHARLEAAARGIDAGAPFAEGHELSSTLVASILPSQIGRKMSGAEAAELIRWLEDSRPSERPRLRK
jgi:hypothetical protein